MSSDLGLTYDHLHVFCTDTEVTLRWFVDVMGASDDGLTLGMPQLHLGGLRILLRGERPGEHLTPTSPDRHFGTDHIGFRVPDLDATVAALAERGVTFEHPIREPAPGVRLTFLRGPDDVRIELLQLPAA